MIRSKKFTNVIRPLLNEMAVSDEVYGQILRHYSPACKCSAKVKTLNYSELCRLGNNSNYDMTIIQNGKVFDRVMNNRFGVAYEYISPSYQINPFSDALVIARNICKDSFMIFRYKPYAFFETIDLHCISCFKYLFEHFNIYKSNGSLAESLDELRGETEVIAISKQTLSYNCYGRSYAIHIILRWYEGYSYYSHF